MDAITRFIVSVDNNLLFSISLILNNPLIFISVVALLLFLFEKRTEKTKKIIFSLVVAALLVASFKSIVHTARPCIYAPEIPCPPGYSFPSLHTGIAFTLMIAFLNKKSYFFFVFLSLFVAFTRLMLGVHIFMDIAGALPLAVLAYYVTNIIWRWWELE